MAFGPEQASGPTPPGARPSRKVHPALITAAEPSYDDQLRSRRIRYAIMMALRVPCLILAALLYQTPWLALTVALLSIPLPWMAVLIANDRLPPKAEKVNRYRGERREIESGEHPVIEG